MVTHIVRDIPTENSLGNFNINESTTGINRIIRAGQMIHNISCGLENAFTRIGKSNTSVSTGCNSHLVSQDEFLTLLCPDQSLGTCISGFALSNYQASRSTIVHDEEDIRDAIELMSSAGEGSGDEYMHELIKQHWLLDGFLCGEFNNTPPEWMEIANSATALWNSAYKLIFHSNKILEELESNSNLGMNPK